MWRMIFVFTLFMLLTACSAAQAAPGEPSEQPQKIEAVDRAAAELAAKLGLDPKEIRVIQVEDAEWSDSCLGLGEAHESCALVLTTGYRITLEADGVQYTYRADDLGSAPRLEQTAE